MGDLESLPSQVQTLKWVLVGVSRSKGKDTTKEMWERPKKTPVKEVILEDVLRTRIRPKVLLSWILSVGGGFNKNLDFLGLLSLRASF